MLKWPAEKQAEYRTKSGLPAPGAAIRIVDSDGNNVAQDGESPGEIVVRAPWLTQGYLDDAKKSEELWKDGWLHTGDVAVIDSQGYIKVTDRIKDVIKTGGEWISSLELENIISQHTSVGEVAVVGIKDPKWGERPLAVVVKKDDNEVDAAELKNFVAKFVKKGVIPKYGAPDRYVFVDKIPKTSVGKLDKKVMRETYKQ
jgi:fatty-acyl-CoA synthase